MAEAGKKDQEGWGSLSGVMDMVLGDEGRLLLTRVSVFVEVVVAVVDVDGIDEGDLGAKVGEVAMATAGVSIAVCVCVSVCL